VLRAVDFGSTANPINQPGRSCDRPVLFLHSCGDSAVVCPFARRATTQVGEDVVPIPPPAAAEL